MDAELRQRICFHEAGHAVAALVFGIPILSVTLEPPRLLRGRMPSPALEHLLTLCYAGAAAESLHCGRCCDLGDKIDNEMARDYLLRMRGGGARFVEMGTQIELARTSAERLVATPWARRRVPLIARALEYRGTLGGQDVYALVA
jgi:hypothetical protein